MCWRIAIDSLRPISNQIWQELPAEDRRRFLRHLKTYWETHRHRMAPEVRLRMAHYEKNGAVEVVAGRLRETRRHGNTTTVRITLRQGSERHLEVDRVINCTGIHESYVDHPRPLIASLIQNGLARANDLGIGFRTDPDGALLDASDCPSPILFTLGPPRRGDLIETTAVPEIRAQAEALAHHLLGERPPRGSPTADRFGETATSPHPWASAELSLALSRVSPGPRGSYHPAKLPGT
jgi:uncharacterized NAD(P)/FAD-binding protein YdhS